MNKALLAARQAIKEKGVVCLNPQEKFEQKSTRKTAIDAFCFQCMGGEGEVGIKWSIGNCTTSSCPLYEYRPFKVYQGKPAPAAFKSKD